MAIAGAEIAHRPPILRPIPCSGHRSRMFHWALQGLRLVFTTLVASEDGWVAADLSSSRSFDAAHIPQRALPAVTKNSPPAGIGEVYRRSHLLGNGPRDLPRTRPARRLPGAQLTVRARPTNYKPRRLQNICLARPPLDALDARCFSGN